MLIDLFSAKRLARYGYGNEPDDFVLAVYRWNIQLSEALYPSMSTLEVALRNRIDKALNHTIESDWLDEDWSGWIRTPSMKESMRPNPEADTIIRTKQKLVHSSGNWSRDKLIAELNFGFWVSLFKRMYHPHLWINKKRPLHLIFPGDTSLKAIQIYKMLDTVRLLRNRIAHHEAIFDRSSLAKDYELMLTLLAAIDPELAEYTKTMDRFPSLLLSGPRQ